MSYFKNKIFTLCVNLTLNPGTLLNVVKPQIRVGPVLGQVKLNGSVGQVKGRVGWLVIGLA